MKTFTLEEARRMLPELRVLLAEANVEFDERAQKVRESATRYQAAEAALAESEKHLSDPEEISRLRSCRNEFQESYQELSADQKIFLERLEARVEELTLKGIVLRNIRDGLVDFPSERNGFEYYLCWRMDEDDISHWHLTSDGFTGRKPLNCLVEYC